MAGKVPLNLAHLIAHRELVMSVSVHFPGKETVLLYTHTAQISKEAWTWMSEHGRSSEHTPECSAFLTHLQCPSSGMTNRSKIRLQMAQHNTGKKCSNWLGPSILLLTLSDIN